MIKLAVAGAAGRMGRCTLELAGSDPRFEVVAALIAPGCPTGGRALRLASGDVFPTESLGPTPNVLIDFSVADGTAPWLEICLSRSIPMVIGATGHNDEQLSRIRHASGAIPIVKAANFSAGIAALLELLGPLARALGEGYDIEIVETHHRHKIDAPSGTALSMVHTILAATGGHAETRGRNVETGTLDSIASDPGTASPRVIFGRRGRTSERPAGQIAVHAVRMGEIIGDHEIHLSGPGETVTLAHTAHSRDTFAAGAIRAAAWVVGKAPGLYSMGDVSKS